MEMFDREERMAMIAATHDMGAEIYVNNGFVETHESKKWLALAEKLMEQFNITYADVSGFKWNVVMDIVNDMP